MRPERWIPFSELHEPTYQPIAGIFDGLYTLAPQLQLTIVSTPITEAQTWLHTHDAHYRDTCSHLLEVLSQSTPTARCLQFYAEVLQSAPLEEILTFGDDAPLGVRMSRFGVLNAIPIYLRHEKSL